MTIDAALADLMDAVFGDYARAGAGSQAAEAATWDGELWGRLSELGLARLTGSQACGGSGAGWTEAARLLRAAAWHAVRVPVAEHDLLACWLLERAGLAAGGARRTACLLGTDGRSADGRSADGRSADGPSMRAAGVPWASQADRVVVVAPRGDGYVVADADARELDISPGANLAGEPRDHVAVRLADLTGP